MVTRTAFRALAVYFILYTAPFPLNCLPWLGELLAEAVSLLRSELATWVGRVVFGIDDLFTGPTGSGDTTEVQLIVLINVFITIVAVIVWSLVDRKQRDHAAAKRWLEHGCAWFLGITITYYGWAKIIPTQFPTPSLTRLLSTYGESSPMGLLWTFMGASPAYCVFTGLAETLGGTLVLFRRTRTLGALICVGVMTNVVMLNLCYDVPVKLFSLHLLALASGLAWLDRERLFALFWSHEAVPARELPPLFASRRGQIAGRVTAIALLAWVTYTSIDQGLDAYRSYGDGREHPPLYGIYDVDSFSLDAEELPPLTTDAVRWRALVIDSALPIELVDFERPGYITIQQMDGALSYHVVEYDTEALTMTVMPSGAYELDDDAEADVLRFEQTIDGLVVTGTWQGQALEARLQQRPRSKLVLLERGFHWINETPYNL
ncbi:hypothetical protein ENSA7_58790 [Enhygromyxa salina]|uniref:DoxX family protein n=2 Tax=Enhygromyxa salina TaxID=215803 RepID=A0A2S9Y839_9BACT|nr:hypothetical protein ENSA7_58790 [Enhygromyxa salina]